MAVQTFPVVEWLVQMNRVHRLAEIIHIYMMQSVQLHLETTVHGVVCVAGVAGFVGGYAVVLKMRCGNVSRIVYE